MRVAVTGSSGLIGGALCDALVEAGHEVVRVSRDSEGRIDTGAIGNSDAVVHLAGESIGAKLRWNEAHKRRVRLSRIDGTRRVAEAMARMERGPRVLISASAVGYYGNRGDEILDENSGPGDGFLAELCVAWEAATGAADDAGIRVVRLRSGIVLSPKGGLLPKLLMPGRLGLGARLGSGKQWTSWISLDDEVAAIRWALDHDDLAGPVNLASPNPVTNAELTKAIGRALHRPAVLAVPAFALKLGLGRETAQETVLTSQRAQPVRLEASGFKFTDRELDGALGQLLAGARGAR